MMEGGCKTAVGLRKWGAWWWVTSSTWSRKPFFFLSGKHQKQELGQLFQGTDRFGACGELKGDGRGWGGHFLPGWPQRRARLPSGLFSVAPVPGSCDCLHQSFGSRTREGAGPRPPASHCLGRVFLRMVCLCLSSKSCHQSDAKSFWFSWL